MYGEKWLQYLDGTEYVTANRVSRHRIPVCQGVQNSGEITLSIQKPPYVAGGHIQDEGLIGARIVQTDVSIKFESAHRPKRRAKNVGFHP